VATWVEFHFDSVRVGERAAALGGAYAALSQDTAGLFYNPAGIAFVLLPKKLVVLKM